MHPGDNELAWDIGFLVFVALLALAGWALIRAGSRDVAPRFIREEARATA